MTGRGKPVTVRDCHPQSCAGTPALCPGGVERGMDNRAVRFAEGRKRRTGFRASQRNLTTLRDQNQRRVKITQKKKHHQLRVHCHQPNTCNRRSGQVAAFSGELGRTAHGGAWSGETRRRPNTPSCHLGLAPVTHFTRAQEKQGYRTEGKGDWDID